MDAQLADRAGRARLLDGIPPERAEDHHDLLRAIFVAEMDFRRAGQTQEEAADEDDWYSENIYRCAWLLHLVGDPSDVPMMWEAKHIDFDIGCMFEVQYVLGAGLDATLVYLDAHGYADVAADLRSYDSASLEWDLGEWAAWRRQYFLGP